VFADLALDVQFLLGRQAPLTAHRATGRLGGQGLDATFFSGLDGGSNRHVPHAERRSNVIDFHALPVQAHRLFAPFVLGLAREPSSLFFFHARNIGATV
jgi:hypothetical protein